MAVGCAHKQQFRVVDSESGKSVANVKVASRKVTAFSYFHRTLDIQDVGVTDANGLITVPKITSKNTIYFSATNYQQSTAGLADSQTIQIGWPVFTMAETRPTPMHRVNTNRQEMVVVPLTPRAPIP
jgi:hypothetical protein